MRILFALAASLSVLLLASCQSMKPSDFAAGQPRFDPTEYFTGHNRSTGVLENRRGAPTHTITTTTEGRRGSDGVLSIEQDLILAGPGGGDLTRQHRSWKIRRLDDHNFEGSANDILGKIHGQAYGNAFHWEFTLALKPGNPLFNVRMSQWMYLQPDGLTMVNHSTLRKAGFVIAQVTEQFAKIE